MADAAVRRKPGLLTKLAYGFGSVGDGIKNNGFEYFLLFFYGQVLGVDFALVGLALLLAMIVDGISDPVVGYWSDNLRTSIGRRHPFMYAAALPVALCYYFVWSPPAGLTGNELFPYLLMMTILVRVSFTFYEVPSSALVAELTDEYDERTSFLSFRYVFGWLGGLTIAFLALAVFLVPTETYGSGFLNVEGYQQYGTLAAGLIFLAVLVCALGTHAHIPHLKAPPPQRKMSVGLVFKEIGETLSNRSFQWLFIATLFGFIANGIAASLNYFINGYFWGFTTEQTSLLTLAVFASAFIALILAPLVSKRFGKKRGALSVGIVAFTLAPLPVVLRLLGLMPPNGSEQLFNIILAITILDIALIICFQILSTSMIADVVEESELQTGRRSEGVFFAGISFMRKVARGSGLFLASLILSGANLTRSLQPEDVPESTLFYLGLGYACGLLLLWGLMICFLSLYKINRADHEANLAALKQARKAGSAPGEGVS